MSEKKIKVLFVASEAVPFGKTGGLADVAGSLPKALLAENVQPVVVMPKYKRISEDVRCRMKHIYDGTIMLSWRQKYIGLDVLEYDGIKYCFVDNSDYFYRDDLYGYDDDGERFAFFCRGVLSLLPAMDFWPDVIHMNDWHTAMIAPFLRFDFSRDERYSKIKTVFTIHNLKYQGVFAPSYVTDVLGLDQSLFNNGVLEHRGALNYMKSALVCSDHITTVSRTYAEEIRYAFFGEGLDGLLSQRAGDLTGIINGIDEELYNPAKDESLFYSYDHLSTDKKLDNKRELQKQLGLEEKRRAPLLAIVSRLVEQKGLDLCVRILDELLRTDRVQLVMLGSGDKFYEGWFRGLAWRFPGRVSVNIGFSEELSRRIYGAADLFLMPSIFEPCGISQFIAMRYGAIPVVHAIGGLKDTVIPFDKLNRTGTGFTFESYNAHDFLYAIRRALRVWEDYGLRQSVIINGMKTDCSWKKGAGEYAALYRKLTEEKSQEEESQG